MNQASRRDFETGIARALSEGSVSIPGLLLKHYKKLHLDETDVMVLIHLLYFREHEQKEFPTWEELQERMAASSERIARSLQRMLKLNLLKIDEKVDEASGMRYEWYNWSPLYAKLAEVTEPEEGSSSGQGKSSGTSGLAGKINAAEANLFSAFEQEFGRPLSPMECETITSWLDQDHYPEELILFALKEAVFAGKVHFKYIDRILLEWSRNRVTTVQQAKEYAQRFRGIR